MREGGRKGREGEGGRGGREGGRKQGRQEEGRQEGQEGRKDEPVYGVATGLPVPRPWLGALTL